MARIINGGFRPNVGETVKTGKGTRVVSRSRRTEPQNWWYTAQVENRTGMHNVFYARTRPIIGESCPGVAAPNKVIGYRCEPAP